MASWFRRPFFALARFALLSSWAFLMFGGMVSSKPGGNMGPELDDVEGDMRLGRKSGPKRFEVSMNGFWCVDMG